MNENFVVCLERLIHISLIQYKSVYASEFQILFWILGVGMMWFLAYKMEMSLVPKKEVEVLVEDIGDSAKA